MPPTRYTIVIADRRTGVVRRLTVGLRPAVAVLVVMMGLPILIGMGAAWKASSEVDGLYASREVLQVENSNYRTATETLAEQIAALQSTVTDLGAQAALDPTLRTAMEKLPAIVKSQAMGGPLGASALAALTPVLGSPEDTFTLLGELLEGLESRLQIVRAGVDKRNQLAAATPSIWPAHGWLSSAVGKRKDPFTGEDDYHAGLDISADRGTPVYATADGTVQTAARTGAYGNLIVLEHGFGLETRYGHLSAYKVKVGDQVKRGDIIGNVGATGRATSSHLHYEVRVNGRLLNPLQLLLNPRRGNAN